MKILVLSDSHRELEKMEAAVLAERPNLIVHLGDHTADAEQIERRFPTTAFLSVRGNCDFGDRETPKERVFQIEGITVMAVHGHRYGVKSGLLRLEYAARERGAQVVLFGHTHIAHCTEYEGLWMLNPGACGGYRASYGIVEIRNGSVSCRVLPA